jgi:hypothetical protein
MARIELNNASGQLLGVVADNVLIPFRPSSIKPRCRVAATGWSVPSSQ